MSSRWPIGPAAALHAGLYGVRIIESPYMPAGDLYRLPDGTLLVGTAGPANEHELVVLEERHAARMIVRRGMADTLEWIGWDPELPLLADGTLPLRGQIRRPAVEVNGETIRPSRWEWPEPPEQHPCGHFTVRPGCGGCDPGAIEYVLDDSGRVAWRATCQHDLGDLSRGLPCRGCGERVEDSVGTPARPECAFDEEW